MEALLDVKEVASLLKVSTDTVYLLSKTGALKCKRIGTGTKKSRVLFRQQDLEEFINAC
jgi:excisionase family DNA binding protein